MEYRPSKLPANISEDAQSLAAYLEEELLRISSSLIENIIAVDLSPAHAVPLRPRTGMIVYADGTDWNPGSGEGVYTFGADAAWHFLNNVAPPTVPSIASQAQQEAASDLTTIVSPGRQQFHPSAAKAWAYITQSAGAYTLAANYNIASINKTGTGVVEVNLTVPMSSTTFAVLVNTTGASSVVQADVNINSVSKATVGIIRSSSEVSTDSGFSICFFGDQ